MKRKIAKLISLLLLLAFLGGCTGGNRGDAESLQQPSSEPEISDTPVAEPSPSPTSEPEPERGFDYEYKAPEAGKYDGSSDLIALSWEEYESKPCRIQAGTVIKICLPEVYAQSWGNLATGSFDSSIYDGLLYMHMNDPEDVRGLLAESWSCSDDRLEWTFNIREGVKFADGTECDANAIAKAWDMIAERRADAMGYTIESWEARSDYEFVVTLSSYFAWFEQYICSLYIPSTAAIELYGWDSYKACVGTGPYYIDFDSFFENYRRNIPLKANRDYFLPERYPSIETVNIVMQEDTGTQINALLEGKLHAGMLNYIDADISRLDGYGGTVKKAYKPGGAIWLDPSDEEILKIKEVRTAFARFADFDEINASVYKGEGLVKDSIWAAGTSVYLETDAYYYAPDEGHALLASVGLSSSDIVLEQYEIYPKELLAILSEQFSREGVTLAIEEYEATLNVRDSYKKRPLFTSANYSTSIKPYNAWEIDRQQLGFIDFKHCRQELYDTELYELMQSEYEQIQSADTWSELLEHCENLTRYAQDDMCVIGGIQEPLWLAVDAKLKNAVYFCTDRADYSLQFYYSYM